MIESKEGLWEPLIYQSIRKTSENLDFQLVPEGGDGGGAHSARTELNCRTPSRRPENQCGEKPTHVVFQVREKVYEKGNTEFFPFQRQKLISLPQHNKKRPDVEGKVDMKSSVSDAFQGTLREMLTR